MRLYNDTCLHVGSESSEDEIEESQPTRKKHRKDTSKPGSDNKTTKMSTNEDDIPYTFSGTSWAEVYRRQFASDYQITLMKPVWRLS